MNKKRYALFFAATGPEAGRNYVPDTNVLLNSLVDRRVWEKSSGTLDVYLFHQGFMPGYIDAAKEAFDGVPSFKFIPVELSRSSVPHPSSTNNIEFIKRARYFKILEYGLEYDAICLMDADMYVVSAEFGGLFDLVCGTRKLIGANERFKWEVGPNTYFIGKEPIFAEPSKMYTMICNVPSFFDMKEWKDVFEYYTTICFTGHQIKNGAKAGIGDLFAHNISIKKLGRESDVHALPMSTFAQVHHVWRKIWTHIINDNDHWRTFAGDRIYCIHDTKKICTDRFVPGNMEAYRIENQGLKDMESMAPKIEAGLRALQKEWFRLNFKCKLRLDRFMPITDVWKEFDRG